MDKNVLKNTAARLNIHEDSVLRKAEEYLRLYQSKASVKTLNDQAKTMLCLDLAAQNCGIGFDKTTALSLSCLKKTGYQNALNNITKVLGLDRAVSVSDLCVHLGCTVIKEDAEEILRKYQKLDEKIKDLDHPQYVAAATYLACKSKKVSIDKTKIISISRLKPSQWKELIHEFENLGLGQKLERHKATEGTKQEDNIGETVNEVKTKKEDSEEIEEYEVWKKRILEEAYAALQMEQVQEK